MLELRLMGPFVVRLPPTAVAMFLGFSFAVDHSRVHLSTDPNSSNKFDYINASYIYTEENPTDKSKAYIAAQG